MKDSKRIIKEKTIIDASEAVFGEVGFKNAKMEDIARKAGITKVTLYSYFQSKENLYLALTYRAMQQLTDRYYEIMDRNKDKSGLEAVLAILEGFMTFCEQNFLYSEVMLDYFSLVRSTSDGSNEAKLTEAVKESIYYVKIQDIQNLPFKLTVKEIERGKRDGSIIIPIDSMLITLYGWSIVVGYVKVISASGKSATPLFHVRLSDLKELNLNIARNLFTSKSFAG
ncbi:MAG TPA: TetR/AcrR family transcriptional regulator [Saprospiraceae bacterium]|jgi:AcrR family transcriptional regulator|nr:TetR/AcrR family transcriptional regulator [Saprospiraceae bacterium]HRO08343.1 TetR/AcrR family transcriptional regulator [Saprospiraceae bacterium]HRO72134.1 TetR/AcrR family transcriptional regulator [Saprospiraceae bacterium]HRP41708.1 TetR/AcrR family transcriptional regulator [Saprospiraceae bacterium]